jgi:glycosyltransferase involved in cell wall biosynthesis
MSQNNQPRIVVYAPHFAEYATRLAKGLAGRADILLILDRKNRAQEVDPSLLESLPANVRWMEFNSIGRVNRMVSLTRIALRIAAFRPDFMIMQEQIDALTAWVARTIGRVVPTCLTVHDPAPHSGADSDYVVRNAHNRRAIRAIARAYHVHGPFCHQQLLRQIESPKPVLETAHGVILSPLDGKTLDFEPGRILMFGRMEAYKGLEPLLDAIDRLEARGVAFKLIIAGRGPELDRLASRIAGRGAIEVLRNFLTPAEASEQFQRAAMVATPYLNATQSGVIAAAFANGRPVVASRTGGLADAVTDKADGLLVTPGDVEELAEALARLLQDPVLQRQLANGSRRKAETLHDWSHIADTMVDFLQAQRAR